MALMIAVGSGAQHRREALASAVTYFVTEFLGRGHIRQAQRLTIDKRE